MEKENWIGFPDPNPESGCSELKESIVFFCITPSLYQKRYDTYILMFTIEGGGNGHYLEKSVFVQNLIKQNKIQETLLEIYIVTGETDAIARFITPKENERILEEMVHTAIRQTQAFFEKKNGVPNIRYKKVKVEQILYDWGSPVASVKDIGKSDEYLRSYFSRVPGSFKDSTVCGQVVENLKHKNGLFDQKNHLNEWLENGYVRPYFLDVSSLSSMVCTSEIDMETGMECLKHSLSGDGSRQNETDELSVAIRETRGWLLHAFQIAGSKLLFTWMFPDVSTWKKGIWNIRNVKQFKHIKTSCAMDIFRFVPAFLSPLSIEDLYTEKKNERDSPEWLWQKDKEKVRCSLCPRQCVLEKDQIGFCGVKKNSGSALKVLNYGLCLQMCEETIESDGIFHYAPGAKTLAIGGFGCSMHCDYCQNWTFSHIRAPHGHIIRKYTPEQIVSTAQRRGIPILSWTYNEPGMNFEFVYDTAKLAHEKGLRNLMNSSFYLSPKAIEKLVEVVDIFVFSLKSLDQEFYRKVCKGSLKPVLDAARCIYESGKHVEYKNLLVAGLNDSEKEIRRLVDWYKENLHGKPPLHFISAHPDYKMPQGSATDVEKLEMARKIALEKGIQYCYTGCIPGHKGMNTYCPGCQSPVIERFGIATPKLSLENGVCKACKRKTDIARLDLCPEQEEKPKNGSESFFPNRIRYQWARNIGVHLHISNDSCQERTIRCDHSDSLGGTIKSEYIRISEKEWRQMVPRIAADEKEMQFYYDDLKIEIYDVVDETYYPFEIVTLE